MALILYILGLKKCTSLSSHKAQVMSLVIAVKVKVPVITYKCPEIVILIYKKPLHVCLCRAYRIGQCRDVTVLRLISLGTVEEVIYLRQVYKQVPDN